MGHIVQNTCTRPIKIGPLSPLWSRVYPQPHHLFPHVHPALPRRHPPWCKSSRHHLDLSSLATQAPSALATLISPTNELSSCASDIPLSLASLSCVTPSASSAASCWHVTSAGADSSPRPCMTRALVSINLMREVYGCTTWAHFMARGSRQRPKARGIILRMQVCAL
jgi:hypothetical protein